jgi:HD domain.
MSLAPLIGCMIEHFGALRPVEHALKVYAYAHGIGGEEGVSGDDAVALDAAAILHDAGIPAALERHGSAAGPYQEKEGERLAPQLLLRGGVPERLWPRISWLVGNHHSEEKAPGDGLLQILMEADYLVNLAEGNLPDRRPGDVYASFFRTETGKRYMRALFEV